LRSGLMSEVRWQGRIGVPETDGGVTHMRERWIELNGSPRAAGADNVIWEGVIVYISAQKEAEEALLRSREELRSLAIHLENVKEDERKAIARDIHDEIGGLIASLKFDISWLQGQLESDAARKPRIDAMAQVLDSARRAAYRIMRDLRPSVLDLGIVAAVDWLAKDFGKRHDIDCTFTSNRESIDLPDAYRTAMFRICQESLTNIVKHAFATKVDIELFDDGESVTLEILDNGKGMTEDAMSQANRFGIRGMRERACQFGGWLEVSASTGNGTSVMLCLPKEREVTK
jgi:two-component system, NarL family, sensor histidine kinase UhpB